MRTVQERTLTLLAGCLLVLRAVRCEDYRVLMIAEVFRNGAATSYGKLSREDKIASSVGYNQSLPNGLRQQYRLGNFIYEDYVSLFEDSSKAYNVSKISMKSSSHSYCMESANSHLIGLFSEIEISKIPKITITEDKYGIINPPLHVIADLNFSSSYPLVRPENYFTVIPIFSKGSIRDFTFFPQINSQCIHIRDESIYHYSNFLTTVPTLIVDFETTLENAGINSKDYFDRNRWTLEDVTELYTYADAHMSYFGHLPYNMTKEIRDEAKVLHTIRMLNFYFSSQENNKIYTSNLGKEILADIELGATGHKSYSGFSAEEHSLIALLVNLKVMSPACYLEYYLKKMFYFSDPQCVKYPEFSSNIIFEMSAKFDGPDDIYVEKDLRIRILYNKNPLEIPFCGIKRYCTLAQFRELVKSELSVEHIEIKCGLVGKISSQYYWTMMSIILTISFFIILFTIFLKCRHKKNSESRKSVDEFISAVRSPN